MTVATTPDERVTDVRCDVERLIVDEPMVGRRVPQGEIVALGDQN